MALFESYERRIDKINEVLNSDRLLERDPFKRELSGGFHSCDLKPQAVGDLRSLGSL